MTKNIYIKKDKKEEVVKDINYIFVTFCVPTFKNRSGVKSIAFLKCIAQLLMRI